MFSRPAALIAKTVPVALGQNDNRPGSITRAMCRTSLVLFGLEPEVETAGIEPASAIAQKVASTSVAGALISLPTRHAGGVVGSQLHKKSPDRLERTSPG